MEIPGEDRFAIFEFLHLRMDNIDDSVEVRRFAKDQVLGIGINALLDLFDRFEPDQFNESSAIRKGGHQPRLPCLPHGLQGGETTFDLYVRQVDVDFVDPVNATSVNILVGEIIDEILER